MCCCDKEVIILSVVLIVISIVDASVFYLGYYVTDKININTSMEALRETVVDSIKESFEQEEGEKWDKNGNDIFDTDLDLKSINEDSEICFGLIIRLEFLPKEIREVKSSLLILLKGLKLDKINDDAKALKLINFIDGLIVSGIAFICGITILFLNCCKCLRKFLFYFYFALEIILIINVIVSGITKFVYQIKEWVAYKGSKIKFTVKFINNCNLKEIFKDHYGFLFSIKKWLVANIFTEIFTVVIQGTFLAIKFAAAFVSNS